MRLLGFIISMIAGINCFAQNYTRDFGLTGGTRSGLCYRIFIEDEEAYEGMLSFEDNGLQISGFKEFFRPAFFEFSDNLWFGYGYGGHAGFVYIDNYHFLFNNYHIDRKTAAPVIGVDALLGLEYRIRELPFIIGINYKPYMQFSTIQFFSLNLLDTGLTFKYRF
ncbi:MAG: hypothetical protein JXB49_12290 [Bacteroidales bacterium]|nr:hypothetical protein [Bacteroidales bacterium]